MFTVTTEPLASELRWTARYEAGYGQRSPAPFGFDGVDSVLSIQGPLGRGFTLRGQAGLGIEGDRSARTTQEIELLKDLRPATRGLGVAMGVGLRREWQGATVVLGRVSAGHSFARSSLFGNLRFERAIEPGRDRVDVLTTLGWRWTFGPLHVGVEAVGEDLEGFWDEEEAEGGAKLFVGPSLHLAPARPCLVGVALRRADPLRHSDRAGERRGPAPGSHRQRLHGSRRGIRRRRHPLPARRG